MKTIFSMILFGMMIASISMGQDNVTNSGGYGYSNPASDITDHFRSKTSGNWHDATTWESSPDGINWTDATLSPNELSNTVRVMGGHTVSVLMSVNVDQLVVDSSAVIVVNGPGADTTVVFKVVNGVEDKDMIVYGTIIATGIPEAQSPFSVDAWGVISFEAGSVYDHNQNGGGIPISTWQPGATLKLTGAVDAIPFNKAQNYSNIIVDLPNLTYNLNMGFNDNIISGDITILNTGMFRWVLVGPVENETRTVTTMGNIYLINGNFNSHGTENPNSTAILHSYGDIIVTGGNFSVVRGAQGGTGTTTWYLYGDLSITNAVTQNGSPENAKFIFAGPNEHNLTLENVTYGAGGLPIQVDSTALNIGTSVLRGDGMFILNPGSVLICANEGGLDSALQNSGTFNLRSEAGYVFNGITPQVTGVKLPSSINSLTVNNPSGVSLSWSFQVNEEVNVMSGNLLLNGMTLTLGSNAMLTETEGVVSGTGKITTVREINAPSGLDIAGMGVVITSAENLGSTVVERSHVPATVNGGLGISRQYFLMPANNSSLNATLRLYYDESELDTISESNLQIFRSPDGAPNNWERMDGMVNTEENYVEVSGVSSLEHFTLAYSQQVVSVKDDLSGIPDEYSLYQNYPNPFNPETMIRFDLPEESFINLSVYNFIGEKVLTLVNEKMDKGKYARSFNASNLPSGVYIYKLTSDKSVFTKKMILIK